MKKHIMTGLGIVAMVGVGWVFYTYLGPRPMEKMREEWQVEAKAQLSYLCNLQAAHFEQHGAYSLDLAELGFMQQENDGSSFWVEIGRADSVEFIARAVALRDFDLDGQMNLWEIRKDCLPVELVED